MSGEQLGLIALVEKENDIHLLYNLPLFYLCLEKLREPDTAISFLPSEDKARERLDEIIANIGNDDLREAAQSERESIEGRIDLVIKDEALSFYLAAMINYLSKYTTDWYQASCFRKSRLKE